MGCNPYEDGIPEGSVLGSIVVTIVGFGCLVAALLLAWVC